MIKPFPTKIVLKLKEMKAGALDLTDQNILSEIGEVVAVGEEVKTLKVGQTVVAKVWGMNHMEVDGESYYVLDMESKALLCTLVTE